MGISGSESDKVGKDDEKHDSHYNRAADFQAPIVHVSPPAGNLNNPPCGGQEESELSCYEGLQVW